MNKRLQLNIYFKRGNVACMVFKRNPLLYRINNLILAKQFVAEMEMLSNDILKSKDLQNSFLLRDKRGKEWKMQLDFADNLVTLSLKPGFNWIGTAPEFAAAVARLVSLMP